ncbi:MAG: hypothetical protein WBC04_14015 [Candidatus Acidiferrales bacterium]
MTAQKPQRELSQSATKIIAGTFAGASAKSDPQTSAESLARGTTIVGRMLEGLSDQYALDQKYAKWVTNFGSVCWHIVELSVPRSLGDIFFRYWLKLATVVAAVFLLLGVVIHAKVEWETGLVLFALVLLLSLLRTYLRRFMLKLHAPRSIQIVAALVAILLTVLLFSALLLGLRSEYRYLAEWLRK